MAKRKITLLYGEGTVQVYFRLPESKRDEIEEKFWEILKGYENPTKVEIDVRNSIDLKVEGKAPDWATKYKEPLKSEKEYYIESEKKSNPTDDNKSTAPEISKFEKAIESAVENPKAKNVDMDALRDIASGKGLKGTFALTKKKVNIDEEYEFEYVKSIPDQDDQIVIDKKGLAFYSKYDLGVFYVKREGKYMRFDSKAEFDRFGKEYLTLI